MKRVIFACLLVTLIILLFLTISPSVAKPTAVQVTPVSPQERSQVEQAINQVVNSREVDHLATLIYQTRVSDLTFSIDGQWARAWLVSTDPSTGDTAPIEPGLAVVRKEAGNWTVYLQADAAWLNAIQASPENLFPPEEKSMWAEMYQQVQSNLPSAPLTGYRLPWKAGESRSLSQSVLHDKYDSTHKAHYAFDFYLSGTHGSQLWDIYAAKSGMVFLAKDDIPTCMQDHCDGQGSGNYMVIKDTTTNPTSYVLYLHLAQNSIPSRFKIVGTPVKRGDIIGVADNTGASYGNHLHFMVHTSPSWWGQSVDIRFDDVSINGGRPRVQNQYYNDAPYCLHKDGFNDVCDNFQTSYISHNIPCEIPDDTPPVGLLTTPITDGVSLTSTLSLSGWGEDSQCGLASGQFIANYNGTWQNIGPAFSTSPFTYAWNTCDIPDGPVEVGLRLTDQAVNSTIVGAYSLSKDFSCPAPPVPACVPTANQVILFDGSDYTGTCIPYEPGDYTNLGSLESQASSILVGANVQASLFIQDDFTGRGETFFANDNNLSDNLIGDNSAGSLRVNWGFQPPLTPILHSPTSGSVIPLNDIVTFFWDNGGFTTDYQIRLTSTTTYAFTSTWQSKPYLQLEGLLKGEYAWQVRGRNPVIGPSTWSSPNTFSITDTFITPPATIPAPYKDTMEITPTKWTATGYWHWVNDATLSHSGTHSWWYQNSDGNYSNDQANTGDLTSPAFTISNAGHYYLRFYYRYATEAPGTDWDQRWLQLSIDGSPFRQAQTQAQRQQLSDDPSADELSDPYLSSQVYDLGILNPGQSVRARFHFDTLDVFKNDFQGWAIDDVSVTTTPPEAPGDANEPNDTPQQATQITSGIQVDGAISPQGDFDYYKFNASTGDRIVADVDAQSLGSLLDPYLFLIDSDGESVLSQNDDEVYAQNRDSFIAFFAPHTGTYYLKLRAWNNPSVGGSQYFYKLHLYLDNQDPMLGFTNPANTTGFLNNQDVTLTATASDAQSGIAQVDFYFHTNNWIDQNWVLLGSDTNGADGWSAPINQPDQRGIAVYVKAIDRSRNVAGQGYWNLTIDRTPPQTALTPLSATQTSTAFQLNWTGSDALSGIEYYQLQWLEDEGLWVDYPLTFTGYTHSTWVIGTPGHSYAFRLRGIDRAGNDETFPATAEASTSIPNNVCPTPDIWEVDNTVISATQILVNQVQAHNFCNPLAQDGLSDTDWITFTAQAGQHYLIQAIPKAENAAAVIGIFTDVGITLSPRVEVTQTVWGKSTTIDWLSTKTEVVYIRIHHTDGRVAGSSVTYDVYISKNFPVYLPVMSRIP